MRNERNKKFLNFIRNRSCKYQGRRILEKKLDTILNAPLTESINDIVTSKLKGIPYAVIGGHAVTILGYPRLTRDIDIMTTPEYVDDIVKALRGKDPTPISIGGMSVKVDGSIVDIVAPDRPWVAPAISNALDTKHGKVISLPYIIVAKMDASRGPQDDTDMLELLKTADHKQIQRAKQLVREYLPNDIEDLKQMILISQLDIDEND